MIGELATIMIIAVVLGVDAFSVSMAMGLSGVSRDYQLKFSAVVALFHIFMPLIGLFLGYATGQLLGTWAGILGALVLAYIGISFTREGYREVKPKALKLSKVYAYNKPESTAQANEARNIILLAGSVSIDALTAGFSLGTTGVPVLMTVMILGIVAGIMTLLGFRGGALFGRLVGGYAQIIGGIILLILAAKIIMV